MGFDVTLLEDVSQTQMKRAIDRFGKKLRDGGVGLFYFSGHGMQVNGRNYLIPVNANVEAEEDVEYESVDAGRVLAKMESARNGMNLVILDACRNNPLARSFRNAAQGLATLNAPSGTFISYATAPGSVASDGSGQNGLYTGELVRHMKTAGLKLEEVFKRVRADVQDQSGDKQVPAVGRRLAHRGFLFHSAAARTQTLGDDNRNPGSGEYANCGSQSVPCR